jgi:hypothetical protein
MRNTVMLGALIALFGAGALAQSNGVTTTEQKSSTEASQPAARAERNARDYRSASREQHGESRKGDREYHDQARERDDEGREHDRRR